MEASMVLYLTVWVNVSVYIAMGDVLGARRHGGFELQ